MSDIYCVGSGTAIIESLDFVGESAASANGYWAVAWDQSSGLVVTLERGSIVAKKRFRRPLFAKVSNARTFAIECAPETGSVLFIFDLDFNLEFRRSYPGKFLSSVESACGKYFIWLDYDLARGRHVAFQLC